LEERREKKTTPLLWLWSNWGGVKAKNQNPKKKKCAIDQREGLSRLKREKRKKGIQALEGVNLPCQPFMPQKSSMLRETFVMPKNTKSCFG